jgi:hypothetical protein
MAVLVDGEFLTGVEVFLIFLTLHRLVECRVASQILKG